ncbi:hypothetical protein Lser_V15G34742 [Lactuca serriola]
MSSQDNNGLHISSGNDFPFEGVLRHVDQGERMFPFSSNGGTGNHVSLTFPSSPPVILPKPHFLQAEKYKVTQPLVASKQQRLGMLGIVFPREMAIDLIATKVEILKSTNQENMFEGSVSQVSMDVKNGNVGSPEKISLSNGMGSAKVKLFDHMVKRKAKPGMVPCAIPENSICFYCQLKGHWIRSYPEYLKDLKDSKFNSYYSPSDLREIWKLEKSKLNLIMRDGFRSHGPMIRFWKLLRRSYGRLRDCLGNI